MIYSIPYVLLILFYATLAWIYSSADTEGKSRIQIMCIFGYIAFFGFRGFIGDDWTNYYPAYEKCSTENFQSAFYSFDDSVYEPGFTLLMLLCKNITDSFFFFVLVCCTINCALLFRFLNKRTDNIPLALVFFLCMGGFVLQTNLMRNSISILLFVNAIGYINQRKALPFFTICTLALMFHSSSILYFPLYFFFHRKCPRWVFLSFFILGNLTFLLRIPLATPVLSFLVGRLGEAYQTMIDIYLDEYGDVNWGLSIGYAERLLTGVLIFCYYDKLIEMRRENTIFINAFLAYFTMYFFFSEFAIIGSRLANVFTFFYWIIWGDIIKCFSIRNNQRLFIVFLSIYCVFKIIGMTRLITLQYDNILWGAKSYEERLYIHEKNKNEDE